MAKRSYQDRPRRPRKIRTRLIVACEGKKTEFQYFLALDRFVSPRRAALKVVQGIGGTAEIVVKRAIAQKAQDETEGKHDPALGDRVYAIIDVEPHDPTKAKPLEKALSLAQANDVKVLLSNPSFEVWLLCHVVTADELKRVFANPDAAHEELRESMGLTRSDARADTRMIEKLVRKASEAVAVAREVHKTHHKLCHDIRNANACTEVYRLVDYLLGETNEPP